MIFQHSRINFRRQFRTKLRWEITSKMACLWLTTIWHESQAQDAPKTPQDAPKMATRRVKKAPKTHARHPQDAPKRPQDAFKMAQDAPRTLPRHPTRAPGRPKTPTRRPKTPPDLDFGASGPGFWRFFGIARPHPGPPGNDLTYSWPGPAECAKRSNTILFRKDWSASQKLSF